MPRQKKKLVIFFLCIGWSSIYAQNSLIYKNLTLSLKDVWQRADTASKTNQLKRIQVGITSENINDARSERLPELNANGNFEEASNLPIYNEGLFNDPMQHAITHTRYRIGVDGYLNIYNGNKINIKITENKALYQLAIENQNATIADTRLRAAAFYLDLQKNYIFKTLAIKDINNQEKQLAKITVLQQQGVILKSDLLRAQLKLSHQRLALLDIENSIRIANQKLNILIGVPDEQVIIPSDEIDPVVLPLKKREVYAAESTNKAYDNRIAEQQTALSLIHLQNIKSNVSLKIGLYGNFNYAYPENFLYPYSPNIYSLGIVGVKLSFPVSAYYLNRHKEKTAVMELQKQKILNADVRDKIRQQINEAYLRFSEDLTRVDVYKINVAQANENYRIVSNTYFNHTALITDLLDANVQLLQAQFDLTTAQVSAVLQYYQLQNISGNL